MLSVKQIQVGLDTIFSFVIQSGQVSEGRTISVSRYVNCHLPKQHSHINTTQFDIHVVVYINTMV